jgi:serine/threonine protein kinase
MSRAEDSLRQPNFDWTTSARNAFVSFASSVPAALLGRETTWTEIPYEQLEFGDLIGAGSFGTVHAGKLFGSHVAIKRFQLINAATAHDMTASIRREIAHLEAIHHPNIVHAFGAVTGDPQRLCIVLERAQCSLYDRLHKPGKSPMRVALVAHYAVQIGSGLAFMHERGLSHRDLKSGNVLVFAGEVVKLADFGLARVARQAGASAMPSTAAAPVGTAHWMAPELHAAVVDPRTGKAVGGKLSLLPVDAYAFGMILFELLAGRVPFAEFVGSPMLLFRALDKGERPALPGRLAAELEPLAAVMRALWATAPADRPRVDRALVTQLQTIADACSTRTDVMPYERKASGPGLRLTWTTAAAPPQSATAALRTGTASAPPSAAPPPAPTSTPGAAAVASAAALDARSAPPTAEAQRASPGGGCCGALGASRARAAQLRAEAAAAEAAESSALVAAQDEAAANAAAAERESRELRARGAGDLCAVCVDSLVDLAVPGYREESAVRRELVARAAEKERLAAAALAVEAAALAAEAARVERAARDAAARAEQDAREAKAAALAVKRATDAAVARAIKVMTLEELDALGALAQAAGSSTEELLRASDVQLGGKGLGAEAAAGLRALLQWSPRLESLDLRQNALGDEGAAALAPALAACATLKALDLSADAVGDVGALALGAARAASGGAAAAAIAFDLSRNTIGTRGWAAFGPQRERLQSQAAAAARAEAAARAAEVQAAEKIEAAQRVEALQMRRDARKRKAAACAETCGGAVCLVTRAAVVCARACCLYRDALHEVDMACEDACLFVLCVTAAERRARLDDMRRVGPRP